MVAEVRDALASAMGRAVEAGVDRSRILVDPGIGFGKTVEHNLLLIRHLDALDALDAPVVLGHSRKSFLRKLLAATSCGREPDAERMEAATLGVSVAAALAGVHVLRVHDVARTRAALTAAFAVQDGFGSLAADDG